MLVDVADDVIRRAQAGERQALVRLVETYQGPVYSLALALVRDPVEAADMTQETFVRLLRSIGGYRGDGANFPGWVHRLTVNVCLDTLRRRQRSPFVPRARAAEATEAPLPEPASNDRWEQPEWRAESDESAHEVRQALAKLPRSQRMALVLHYFDNRPYDEIAAAMGVPLNTVKSHVLRGKERMARLLGQRRLGGGLHEQTRFGTAPRLPRLRYAAAT